MRDAAGTADVDVDEAALSECLKYTREMLSVLRQLGDAVSPMKLLNARAYFACCLTLSDSESDEHGDGDGDNDGDGAGSTPTGTATDNLRPPASIPSTIACPRNPTPPHTPRGSPPLHSPPFSM